MIRLPRFLIVILAVAFLDAATSALAQDAVDKFVQSEMQKQHIPGLSLLVARSGKIVRAQGYGLGNVELQVPVKPETVFQSGSLGKQFTATAVMMLIEEGKVRLDDPVTRYIKRWRRYFTSAKLEPGYGARVAEPYRRLHRLSQGLRLSQRLYRGGAIEDRRRDSAGV